MTALEVLNALETLDEALGYPRGEPGDLDFFQFQTVLEKLSHGLAKDFPGSVPDDAVLRYATHILEKFGVQEHCDKEEVLRAVKSIFLINIQQHKAHLYAGDN